MISECFNPVKQTQIVFKKVSILPWSPLNWFPNGRRYFIASLIGHEHPSLFSTQSQFFRGQKDLRNELRVNFVESSCIKLSG